ncbi:uncharacterized protein RCH25_036219 [Pelodytes ibericus]
MPVILPHLPEYMFASYDPNYTPGYTSFVPKLRSDTDNIYGNATLKFLDYEPGLRRGQRVSFAGCSNTPGPSRSAHYTRRMFHEPMNSTPQKHVGYWNNKNDIFYPGSGKYHFTQMDHIHDGDPRASSAIHTVEETKNELNKPLHWESLETERYRSLRHGLESTREQSYNHGTSEQLASFSRRHAYEDMRMSPEKEKKERKPLENMSKTNDYLQKRQGKTIYRTDSGLIPNYSGYTPGQMFSFGKTWGRSSMNAVEKAHKQPFLWTSLF